MKNIVYVLMVFFLLSPLAIGDSYTPAKDATLSAMSAKLPSSLGQKTKANSMSCTKASDEDPTAVTGTFWQVTQPVSLSTLPSLVAGSAVIGHVISDAGSAIIGKVGIDQTTPGTTNGVQINAALPAGSNVIGHIIADTGSTTAVTGTVTVGTHAITVASGGIASGALASGSVASGAIASGAVASGAFASGSIAAGAVAAGGSSFVKIEDVGSADADAGVPAMAVRKATPANTSGNDGDYEFLQMSAGRLWTSSVIDTALPSGTNVIGHVIADSGSTTAVTGTVTVGTHAVTQSGTWTTTEGTTAGAGNPCMNPQATLVSISGATSTTNATQIIALSGSTKIHICAMSIVGVSGTTPFFSLVYGTGSNCASGQTVLVQTWATAAGTIYTFGGPVAVAAAGNAVCYKDTGTNPVQNYTMTYVQL